MTVTADQVGKLYDILIATRDGSTLACLDHNGKTQQVNQVAYMLSTTKPSTEATEIQRKDQLVQLSSAQMIDRDFDAYPQVAQGDWSDGTGQRVFSGQGEALGTVSNKSTRYWDGQGLLYPLSDYLPQQGFQGVAQTASATTPNTGVVGAVGGNVQGRNGYAIATFTGGLTTISFIYSTTTATISNAFGQGLPILGMAIGVGYLWVVANLNATTVALYSLVLSAPTTLAIQNTINLTTDASGSGGSCPMTTGQAGNKRYVACGLTYNLGAGGSAAKLFVVDVTNPGAAVVNPGVVFAQEATASTSGFDSLTMTGVAVIAAVSETTPQFGGKTAIVQFDIASQTTSTLEVLEGYHAAFICHAAGGVFIAALVKGSSTGDSRNVELFLLQGSSLQSIGPLITPNAFIQSLSQPVAFGSYVFFATWTSSIQTFNVYAYDVLRGRLFRAYTQTFNVVPAQLISTGFNLAVCTGQSKTGTNFSVIGIFTPLCIAFSTVDINNGAGALSQEVYFAFAQGQSASLPVPIQIPVDITSSVIDFTSAQNKLYRQIVTDFTALPNNAAATVRLRAWLDQDPAALNVTPDFDSGVVAGGGANTGLQQLKLPINKIARRLVYRVTTGGAVFVSNDTPVAAPKLQSVKIQVATGWALHYFLDISRNATCNDATGGSPTYCFQNQAPVDDFAAHAFLKQLWRLKGGECIVTLPTGETYNALLQLISAENVKHVIQSGLSDTPVVKSVIVELKIREDV